MSKLIAYLQTLPPPAEGRMYGYLVAQDAGGNLHELWAYSGAAAPDANHENFVALPYDVRTKHPDFAQGERDVVALTERIKTMAQSPEFQQAQRVVDDIRRQAKNEIEVLKVQMADRKKRRDVQRQQGEGGEEIRLEESRRDRADLRRLKAVWQTRQEAARGGLQEIEAELSALREERAQLSARLQRLWFELFAVENARGERKSLLEIFAEIGEVLPPSGTGECAAPKLIAAAYKRGLMPIKLEEFWWGPPPENELRRHGFSYSPCRGRCHPLLRFMLQGTPLSLPVEPAEIHCQAQLEVLLEQPGYVVVHKPHGLLSVPGKRVSDSVLTRVQERYPNASGPMMVHRLDQATSGVMIVALDHRHYHHLQQQFLQRTIEKRYVAVLEGVVETDKGVISLPLRVDPMDRPRQVVDRRMGKEAITRWEKIEVAGGQTKVYFWPQTGRTHQLRVHAAHPEGLNAPIEGDALYGAVSDRLMLFAEFIAFEDPITGKRQEVSYPLV